MLHNLLKSQSDRYRVSEPPMSFLDKGSKPNGYSMDICKCIVHALENKNGAQNATPIIIRESKDLVQRPHQKGQALNGGRVNYENGFQHKRMRLGAAALTNARID
jgi:ABC-type amino acid transport substrate-binding protein